MGEHRRPDGGLAQGYYCLNCGAPGMNMYGMSHRTGPVSGETRYTCEPDPTLVALLNKANEQDER